MSGRARATSTPLSMDSVPQRVVLAVCLLVVGIKKGSLPLCIGGWFFSALSFFIKPSGGLVMAAMIGIAAIELIIRYLRHPEQIRSMLKFAAWVLLSCIPVYGFAFWTAFGSDYLGDNTVSAGIKAQGILRLISEREDLTAAFVRFIVPIIGWWWFCPMAFCLILIVLETVPNTAVPAIECYESPDSGLPCSGECGDLLVAVRRRHPKPLSFSIHTDDNHVARSERD